MIESNFSRKKSHMNMEHLNVFLIVHYIRTINVVRILMKECTDLIVFLTVMVKSSIVQHSAERCFRHSF